MAMILDVKCAFLYGESERHVYIELPSQDPMSRGRDKMGLLHKAMSGARDAPLKWQREVKDKMEQLGFYASVLQPAVYSHRDRKLEVVAHVDDFLCTGARADLLWLQGELKKFYEISSTFLGDHDEREAAYLNRVTRWTSDGLEYECDPKHAQVLLREMGYDGVSPHGLPYEQGHGGAAWRGSTAGRP